MYKMICLMLSVLVAPLLMSCSSGSTSEKTADAAIRTTEYVSMPANTEIAVTLVDSIDTDVQKSGDEFRASLSRPVVVNDHVLFAEGAGAKGILSRVVESGHLKTPAELNFSLTAIQDGQGRWVEVGTNTIVDEKASHTNREVAMIGGGAIVGGIIGKIVDRKGSTEIGAVAGAVAGTGLAAATGKNDIFYGAGTEVVFFSSQPMEVALD